MGSEWGGKDTSHQGNVCQRTCPKCNRRCAKNKGHFLKHRCLRHGSF